MTKLRILALTYRTFPAAVSSVQETTVDVLKRMGMRVLPEGSGVDGSASLLASSWRRQLEVEFEPRGIEGTRVRVLCKDGVFFEENAAAELVTQVARRLEQRREKPIRHLAAGSGTSVAILSTKAEPASIAA